MPYCRREDGPFGCCRRAQSTPFQVRVSTAARSSPPKSTVWLRAASWTIAAPLRGRGDVDLSCDQVPPAYCQVSDVTPSVAKPPYSKQRRAAQSYVIALELRAAGAAAIVNWVQVVPSKVHVSLRS